MVEAVSWDRPYSEPIELPKGKKLVTLRDAATYITKLPKAEHDTQEWQAAMEEHLLVVERRADDVRPDRSDASAQPSCRTGVQPVAEGPALGTAKVGAGPIAK